MFISDFIAENLSIKFFRTPCINGQMEKGFGMYRYMLVAEQ